MLRVLRRHSPRQLEVAHLDEASLHAWAERGFLRRNDLCAVPDLGTLAVAEVPALSGPMQRGARRDVADFAVAAGLAAFAGVAVKVGGTAGGVASLPLVAAAHVWLQGIRFRRDASLESLPRNVIALKVAERQARKLAAGDALKRLAAVVSVGATALLPVGLFAKLGAGAVTAIGARRLLRRWK